MKWFDHMKLVLASASPRRAELMQLAGYQFSVRVMEIEEIFPEKLDSFEVAEYLAVKKAIAQSKLLLSPDELLIAADSVVIVDKQVLGKPTDRAEAIQMIHSLSGRTHHVVSGVCIKSRDKQLSFSVSSKVFFKELEQKEIEYYIEVHKPFDKAGSYGIQEWIGLNFIEKIEGSYTNIMGLPMQALYKALKEW